MMGKLDRPASAKRDFILDKSMGDTQSKFNSTSVIKLKKSKNKVSNECIIYYLTIKLASNLDFLLIPQE